MPTDGQLISLMSHTIGSIGQVFKDKALATNLSEQKALTEIKRIYDGYITQIQHLTNKKE